MDFKEIVKAYLREASKKERGYKAMSHSAGLSTSEGKKEMHKLKAQGTMEDIKKRARSGKVSNPNAYIYGTERKILKQHAAKMGR